MRSAGVLLHPTALPGPGGCGGFGQAAHDWVELLGCHEIGVWQLLPLAPTDGTGSPYSSPSGSALNPWLLDGERLVQEGFLQRADLEALPGANACSGPVDLGAMPARSRALGEALARCWPGQSAESHRAFGRWRRRQSGWLADHALFMVIRRLQGGQPWWLWPAPLASRQWAALRRIRTERAAWLLEEELLQWQLERQWQQLRCQAGQVGVQLLGDLPFYVAHDSADVWAHRSLFSLRPDGRLTAQSGVPPDYFSATGQLWGTPVYRWPLHLLSGFRWWLGRLQRQFDLFDRLRLDHFRALQAYWSVPGDAPTAENGRWCWFPGWPLLSLLWLRQGMRLPLIAEDLGVITPAVEALRDGFQLPGMKILQFAFDGDPTNPYLPANIRGNRWVVYTGTHDNATSVGWWQSLDDGSRQRLAAAVGAPITAPAWQLLELALASSADLAVVPLQDLLELDDRARFNTPGTSSGNWIWRLDQPIASLDGALQGFGAMAARYGRGV
ncbi:MAG: 4-alpha-glucanotransferase [Cyanobium sp.]